MEPNELTNAYAVAKSSRFRMLPSDSQLGSVNGIFRPTFSASVSTGCQRWL